MKVVDAVRRPVRLCAVLLAVCTMVAISGCADRSDDGGAGTPYCGVFSDADLSGIIGEVHDVRDEYASGVIHCYVEGANGVIYAYASRDSWVDFGEGGNSAVTTLRIRTGTEGRVIDGTNARVFSFLSGDQSRPQAQAYWLEGRAGIQIMTIDVNGVDETTVAALEDLVVTYAPRVLEGEPAVTEDPGPDLHPTGVPSPPPSAEPTSAPPVSPVQSEPPAGLTTPQ